MYKNLDEYLDFLIAIGKHYGCDDDDKPENERLTEVQQEVLTGFYMRENDYSHSYYCKALAALLIGDEEAEKIALTEMKENLVCDYYDICVAALDEKWSQKQCVTKSSQT
jgi:hypothetical protein